MAAVSTISCSPSSRRVVIFDRFEIILFPWPTRRSFSALAGRPRYVGGSRSGSRFTHARKSWMPVDVGRIRASSFSTSGTSLWSSSNAAGVRKVSTSLARSAKSPASSIFPPYVSVINVRIRSQGIFCGATFERPWAIDATQVSMINAEHSYYRLTSVSFLLCCRVLEVLTSLSLNSQKPLHPRLGAYRSRS